MKRYRGHPRESIEKLVMKYCTFQSQGFTRGLLLQGKKKDQTIRGTRPSLLGGISQLLTPGELLTAQQQKACVYVRQHVNGR